MPFPLSNVPYGSDSVPPLFRPRLLPLFPPAFCHDYAQNRSWRGVASLFPFLSLLRSIRAETFAVLRHATAAPSRSPERGLIDTVFPLAQPPLRGLLFFSFCVSDLERPWRFATIFLGATPHLKSRTCFFSGRAAANLFVTSQKAPPNRNHFISFLFLAAKFFEDPPPAAPFGAP